MTQHEFDKICRWLSEGGELFVKRTSLGTFRLKVVHGPMGLFAHRFEVDYDQFTKLKLHIQKSQKLVA